MASACASGPWRAPNDGAMPHSRQSTFSRQTEVALFSVRAMLSTWARGICVKSWIESTAPNELIEMPGSSASDSACRAYSIDEGRATSISPAASSRLSSAGVPSTISASYPRPAELLDEVAVEREAVDELDAPDARAAAAAPRAPALTPVCSADRRGRQLAQAGTPSS